MSHSANDMPAALERSRRVLEDLFGPPEGRGFSVRYWDGQKDGPPQDQTSAFTLILRVPCALRRAFLPPTDRSMALAFVRGHIDIDGDIEAAAGLAETVRTVVRSPRGAVELLARVARLPRARDVPRPGGESRQTREGPRTGILHSRARDRASVRHHYDVGNEFFRLFLDARMVYSCAYFEQGGEPLDAAQEAKLDLICRKLRVRPGDRLLDIGCGWGSLVEFAATRFGARAVGVTLSTKQADVARRRIHEAGIQDRCTIEVCDYRDLNHSEEFDKVASVGMVEHVGKSKLRAYFRCVDRLLKPGGLFLNHGIVDLEPRAGRVRRMARRGLDRHASFMQRFVFPDSELVSPTELIEPGERAGLELRDFESLREHYAFTLRQWVERLEANASRAVAEVGEETYRVWRLYMAASAGLFAAGKLGVCQALWAKPHPDGRISLPRTRVDLYRPGV